jgi:hypothetical protein
MPTKVLHIYEHLGLITGGYLSVLHKIFVDYERGCKIKVRCFLEGREGEVWMRDKGWFSRWSKVLDFYDEKATFYRSGPWEDVVEIFYSKAVDKERQIERKQLEEKIGKYRL